MDRGTLRRYSFVRIPAHKTYSYQYEHNIRIVSSKIVRFLPKSSVNLRAIRVTKRFCASVFIYAYTIRLFKLLRQYPSICETDIYVRVQKVFGYETKGRARCDRRRWLFSKLYTIAIRPIAMFIDSRARL